MTSIRLIQMYKVILIFDFEDPPGSKSRNILLMMLNFVVEKQKSSLLLRAESSNKRLKIPSSPINHLVANTHLPIKITHNMGFLDAECNKHKHNPLVKFPNNNSKNQIKN